MRRVFLAAGLLAFLAGVLSWPLLGCPSRWTWPLGALLMAGCAWVVLLETRGPRIARAALTLALAFGLAFPRIATRLTDVYGFPDGVPPGAGLVWGAFLVIALALGDQLRWNLAVRRGTLQGAWLTGLALAGMELLWDPALLAEGAMWSRAPAFGSYPLGYTPGFPVLHALIGWAFARLVDRMEASGREGTGAALRAAGLLLVASLVPVLLSSAAPPPELPLPWWVLLGLDLAGAALICLPAILAVRAAAPRLLRRRGARVLLTTTSAPVEPYQGGHYPLDFYSSRSTRGQGPWTGEIEGPYLAAHMLARNLESSVVVLEYPDEERLEEELREVPYEVVGIGFTVVSREAVRRLCQLIRRVRPEARIVLGGYGVVCLEPTQRGDEDFEGLVDAVCSGEGVDFLRELLGEDAQAPRDLALPPQRMYPMGLRLAERRMQPLVVGFGCDKRCGFCGTSAFFEGRNIRLADAASIARVVRGALKRQPEGTVISVFDEDYLADRARVEQVAELLRTDPEVDFARVQFSVFATSASLEDYSPADLVRLGVAYVWVGVESKFTNLRKRGGTDVALQLEALEAHGIAATISWILGFDHQTPENLEEDLEWMVALPSVTAQVSLLGPLPGTPLHRQLRARDRLIPRSWDRHHLYEECMEYEHFPPGELTPWVERAYRELYLQRGPSLLRTAEVWWRGAATLGRHPDAFLQVRSRELLRQLEEAAPALVAMAFSGEYPDHRARARALLDGLGRSGRTVGAAHWLAGLGLGLLVRAHRLLIQVLGLPARQPRPVRTRYPGV